ncbi:3-oxoacyl-[acyl-carrier-protein] reductase [Gehongia tenuis]|uniref:3-oxoacyl-[acyl-carrier-protein] reductase n=1 Tax=Gehongia tenuis TaxID=2763655 RepID=A0A926D325_9FIRM|nr:3-oxoacyl-[acyl-carrier-protein] reductase [Gehongia tenuis]
MMEIKCAVVTGASRGIGRGIALELARRGMNVVINYNSSAEAADALIREIEEMGVRALAVQADVSDFEAAGRLIQKAEETFGRVDVLVNNAGITRDGLLMRMKEEDFDRVIEVNLKSAFNCMRHAVRGMGQRRYGRIVSLSSVAGVVGNAGQANYSASKAGVIGLTKAAARELARRGITVNAVAPGFIDTDMTAAMPEAARTAVLATVPMQRGGRVEDVAKAVAFLVSDDAAYITGQVLSVDGGLAM